MKLREPLALAHLRALRSGLTLIAVLQTGVGFMRKVRFLCAALLALAAGQLAAQTCADGSRLTAAQIQAALGNRWFCAQKVAGDPNSMWREFIPNAASGTFQECHSGKTSGPDPIDPNKGAFAIAGDTPGTIRFDYGGGNAFTYWLCNGSAAGQYVFRDTAGGSSFFVYLSTCPSSGISDSQKTNCPP